MKKLKFVTCKKCGWVHMGVTKAWALAQVKKFNAYYRTLSVQDQHDFYGGKKSSLEKDYKYCQVCGAEGNKVNFRLFKAGDCPDGCTIGPVIYE